MRRRTTQTQSSPLAKAGKMLGGLLSSRSATQGRSGGRRGGQSPASGLSKLLRSTRR